MNELISDGGGCRTGPATLGLLKKTKVPTDHQKWAKTASMPYRMFL